MTYSLYMFLTLLLMAIMVVCGFFSLAKRERNSSMAPGIAAIVAAIVEACVAILAYPVPSPVIYPAGGELTVDNKYISFESELGIDIYYTFDQMEDLRLGNGYRFDGEPFEIEESKYLIARSKGLFRWSEPVTVYITTYEDSRQRLGVQEGGTPSKSQQEGNGLANDSQTVSDQRTDSYPDLPGSLTSGWGDDGGGRESITIDEINAGKLGDRVVLNSISDGAIGNEKNFVGARESQYGVVGGTWKANLIDVEPGKRYVVRIYGHNNSPRGIAGAANGVQAMFSVPSQAGRSIVVDGKLRSSNAQPQKYWDGVVFTSDDRFRLQYVEGSARLYNGGIGENGGCILSDSIVSDWQSVGYSELDGIVPGCYQYAFVVAIEVDVVAA